MPIRKVEGGWKASYAGRTATFKTKAAAEKWSSKYTGKKKAPKKEVANIKRARKGRVPVTPKKFSDDYNV